MSLRQYNPRGNSRTATPNGRFFVLSLSRARGVCMVNRPPFSPSHRLPIKTSKACQEPPVQHHHLSFYEQRNRCGKSRFLRLRCTVNGLSLTAAWRYHLPPPKAAMHPHHRDRVFSSSCPRITKKQRPITAAPHRKTRRDRRQ